MEGGVDANGAPYGARCKGGLVHTLGDGAQGGKDQGIVVDNPGQGMGVLKS